MQEISVIVCTYNRLSLLKKCLESLQKQNYNSFETIVVNDASTDGTREFLDSQSGIKVVHHGKSLGLSSSRNDGIKSGSFDLIAFIDDDCVADKNWLSEIERGFVDPNVDFGTGQTFLKDKTYIGRFPERVVTNIGAKWPKGNNLFFRKKVFDIIGTFNPKMDYYCNDDSEIAIRAISQGFKFISLPQAIVYHQITYWTVPSLLKSARNPSVWIILKKLYPNHYQYFRPPVKFNFLIHPEDYFYILTMPILIPLLFLRFVINGQSQFKLFFTKWPLYPFLRRFYIYREAIRNKTLML